MKKIIKIKPHFEYRVWAGNYLSSYFERTNEKIGEAWLVSALENKSSIIDNLDKEVSLYEFYSNSNNAKFFNGFNLEKEYPLLAKIIDAKSDLSIQIHPDDEYAKKHNSLGKTESWYILDTKENNSIILGHSAKTLQEFKQMVEDKKWDQLLLEKPIKKNDFIYVPSKKIHAIKSDTLIYELQQSSDITYRVYDYDRLDNGQKRELHLEDVFNVVECPDKTLSPNEISSKEDYLIYNEMLCLKKIKNYGLQNYIFSDAHWVQITIIEGSGLIEGMKCNKFDSFLVAHNEEFSLDGNVELLVSYVKK